MTLPQSSTFSSNSHQVRSVQKNFFHSPNSGNLVPQLLVSAPQQSLIIKVQVDA